LKNRKKLVVVIAAMLLFVTISPVLTSDALSLRELWCSTVKDNITFRAAIGDVNGDGKDELAVMPVDELHAKVTNNTLQVLGSDGNLLWEKSLEVDMACVAVKDIDLDGKSEVFVYGVLSDYGYIIYALDHEGNLLWKFASSCAFDCCLPNLLFLNLDEDEELEVFVVLDAIDLLWLSFDQYTHVALDDDGSLLWEFKIKAYRNFGTVCDVTGDGKEEIILVCSGGTYEDTYVAARVYALTKSGNILWQLGLYQGDGEFLLSTGDMTGDNINEIVIAASSVAYGVGSALYVIKSDGTILWRKNYIAGNDEKPKTITNPLLIDVDGDMKKDVVLYCRTKIYCYKNDGIELWTFDGESVFDPDVWQYYYMLASFDTDCDGKDEIIFGSEDIYSLSTDGKELRVYDLPEGSVLTWMTPGWNGWKTGRGVHEIVKMNAQLNKDFFKALVVLKFFNKKFYVAAVTMRTATQETNMELTIIDREKWYTNLNVPFDIPGAEQYVIDARNNGKPSEEDFSIAPMNIQIKNTGSMAENVVVTVTVSGFVVLISFDEKDKYEDLVFPKDLKIPFYSFEPYSVANPIGSVDAGSPKPVQLNIPIKYMSVLVGRISYKMKDNNDLWMDILITIVELDVKVKVSGDNFQTVESSTKVFGVGDPAKLLEQWNKALRERVKHLQKQALEELLKRQMSVSALATNTKLYSEIGIGTYRFDTTVKIPETNTLVISTILAKGVTLAELSVAVGSIIVSMPISVVNGFAMIMLENLEKILPKGTVTAEINLRTETEVVYTRIAQTEAQVEQQNSILVTSITVPEFFEVSRESKNYDVAIASNTTISSCQLNEHGICFNVIGISNEVYFYKITVPSEAIVEDFEVWCENEQIHDFELAQNATHSFLYFVYSTYKENYTITIVPEFSLIVFLLLFFALTLIIIKTKTRMTLDNKRLSL
jgi:hypothetical protein